MLDKNTWRWFKRQLAIDWIRAARGVKAETDARIMKIAHTLVMRHSRPWVKHLVDLPMVRLMYAYVNGEVKLSRIVYMSFFNKWFVAAQVGLATLVVLGYLAGSSAASDDLDVVEEEKSVLVRNLDHLARRLRASDAMVEEKEREMAWVKEQVEYSRMLVRYHSGLTPPDDVPKRHLDQMLRLPEEYGVPKRLFLRLVFRESGFDPTGVSSFGATGYCGVLPQTLSAYRTKVRRRPGEDAEEERMRVSCYMLRELHSTYVAKGKRGMQAWRSALLFYGGWSDQIGRVPTPHAARYVGYVLSGVDRKDKKE